MYLVSFISVDTDDSGNNTVDELEEDPEEESASHNNYHRDDMQIRFILEPAPEEKTLSQLPHKFIVCSEHTPVSAIKKVVCKQLSLTTPNQVCLWTCKYSVSHRVEIITIKIT